MVLALRTLLRRLAGGSSATVPLEGRVRALTDEALYTFRHDAHKRSISPEQVRFARNRELQRLAIDPPVDPRTGEPKPAKLASDNLKPNLDEDDRKAAVEELKAADEEIRRRKEKKVEDEIAGMPDEKLKDLQNSLEYARSQGRLDRNDDSANEARRRLSLAIQEIHRRDSGAQRERDSRDKARTKVALRTQFVSWISLAIASIGLAVSLATFFLKK